MHRSHTGFTLVELSIVLVIVGLLVGGVLAGQSLLRSSQLNAVIREHQKYRTALAAFNDKYAALPGDMTNAVLYWGAQAGSSTATGVDATCIGLTAGEPATGMETCNGNGDGMVALTAVIYPHEMFRAWQHLSNAGLVEGRFTGVRGSVSPFDAVPGKNIPNSKLAGAAWFLFGLGTYEDANYNAAAYGNALVFGGYVAGTGPYGGVIPPIDALNIDTKVDDGKPNKGKVLTYKYALLPNCAVSTNDAYNLAVSDPGCSLIFTTGF